MEVMVCGPAVRSACVSVWPGASVGELLEHLASTQGVPLQDFYLTRNGRLSDLQDPVERGGVYRVQPRLVGGKGGFGSMLRALGAQIEKTTNREACRDLSGRRLRDVNHEKEMAEWLKKQTEREAEREQRRLERLHRKLQEPRHQFTDPEYQQQCHLLSERLEDSVLQGMQACSSGLVQPEEGPSTSRALPSQEPPRKRKCFWTGVEGELSTSEEEMEEEESICPERKMDHQASLDASHDDVAACSSSREPARTTPPRQATPPRPAVPPARQEQPMTAESGSCCPALLEVGQEGAQMKEVTQEGAQMTEVAQEGAQMKEVAQEGAQMKEVAQEGAQMKEVAQEGAQMTEEAQMELPAAPLDLEAVSSVQELERLGLAVLKEQLQARGLKCGGSLEERAARLFSIRGRSLELLEPSLLARPGKAKRKR